jgi:alkyl sulfatase BDS1-like metallo-beta-lactamase superfamily hydrolase
MGRSGTEPDRCTITAPRKNKPRRHQREDEPVRQSPVEERMASVEECEQAFHALADRLAAADPAARKQNSLDRSLSCTVSDIDIIFGARLHDGLLTDIRQVDTPDAEVKLKLSSDDLVQLVAGELKFASAWAGGRVKVDARVFDLIKLRSIF